MSRYFWKAARVTFDVTQWLHHVTARTPVIGPLRERIEDIILDRIFGPVEDFDYVSTTAPSSPPPPRL